jgi:hypothetical protein
MRDDDQSTRAALLWEPFTDQHLGLLRLLLLLMRSLEL